VDLGLLSPQGIGRLAIHWVNARQSCHGPVVWKVGARRANPKAGCCNAVNPLTYPVAISSPKIWPGFGHRSQGRGSCLPDAQEL